MAKFTPGKSGNPRGRPKGARNLAAQYLAEINAPSNNEPEAISKLQATIRAQVSKALEGDLRAIRDVIERAEKLEAARSAERGPNFTDSDREAIAEIQRRLAPAMDAAPAATAGVPQT